MSDLPGHYVLDPARYLPTCDIKLRAEVHDKRTVDRERRFVLRGLRHRVTPWLLAHFACTRGHFVPKD